MAIRITSPMVSDQHLDQRHARRWGWWGRHLVDFSLESPER
jgi:hypothetical protein